MRLKLISCEVFFREMAAACARSPNQVELEFISGASCSHPCAELRSKLQATIDHAGRNQFQGFLLGYGLCQSELAGLRAGSVPLVLPRACDCLSRLLQAPKGNFEGLQLFSSGQGMGRSRAERNLQSFARQLSSTSTKPPTCGYQQLAARYGEEVARYLYDEFGREPPSSRPNAFFPKPAPARGARPKPCQTKTDSLHWAFDASRRQAALVQKLVDGYWDYQDFVVVPPRWHVVLAYDGNLGAQEAPR